MARSFFLKRFRVLEVAACPGLRFQATNTSALVAFAVAVSQIIVLYVVFGLLCRCTNEK